MARASWSNGLGAGAKWLGIAAVVAAIAGTTLARYDIIAKMQGFYTLGIGLLMAVLGVAIAVISILVGIGASGAARRPAVIGLLASGALLAVIASYVIPARGAPPIHDVTTDLDNPPQFSVLPLRKDNLVIVETVENWKKIHAKAYPDIKTVTIAKPVAQVIADADRIAKARGWSVAVSEPEKGHFEATAYAAWIKFRDDVVLRVEPTEDGKGSVVDMRSVSQVGGGDLGYNANRIRSFLKELQGG